ncbi:MAG: S8 family serine peptidase [Candidatus Thorarchaeota archaeon]|nr:S8 family serine peptidase [Candidatus Thorarchaeota archaeon]
MLIPIPALVSGISVKTNNSVPSIIAPSLQNAIKEQCTSQRIPVVFQFPDGTPSSYMEQVVEQYETKGVEIRHVFHLIPMVSAYATNQAIVRLAVSGYVNAITLDIKVGLLAEDPVDGIAAKSNSGYVHPDKILNINPLWEKGYNGSGTTIALLDSGAWGGHPDLAGKIIGFKDFVNNHDDMNPADGINSYDDNGHGTGTAWLAAGTNMGTGNYSGMAPGADLLIVKILDSSGTTDDSIIAQGIEFAVDQGVDVISMSIGGLWTDSMFADPSVEASKAAISNGVAVVIAAGNSGPATETINAPGITEEAITVGASNGADAIAQFSSRGPVVRNVHYPRGRVVKPDVIAPGENVVSGRWSGANPSEYIIYNSTQFGNYYTMWSGTSVATPLVAGVVAILVQQYPGLSPLAVKAFLMAGATDLDLDAMAQGMGLVNANRSATLINETSRIITLMTPLRYPTLPEGSSVLIVGDDRPNQKVTIISTVNRGKVDIVMSGNATNYVNVSTNIVSVQTGYSYFSIGMNISGNLPLSAVGTYTGNLSLVVGTEIIASLDISYSITTYGGRLLVDMLHQSDDDPDDPRYYNYFGQELREAGMITDRLEKSWLTSHLTPDDLSNSESFMIMDTELDYTDSEINAIHEYVRDGGTLLILSEYYDPVYHNASYNMADYNKILAPYGIQCEKNSIGVGPSGEGLVYGADYGGAVENDPLVDDVRNLYIVYGGTLSIDPSVAGARGLLWTDAAKTHALIAEVNVGRGRVVAIADGSTLYDDIINKATEMNADNLQFVRNLAQSIIPVSPRIYGVDFEAGRIGDTANLTVYIFDEDLQSVAVHIEKPDGTNVTSDVIESLGYKFATSFVIDMGGFYHIYVQAYDSTGHLRVYEKTILIQVQAADDVFITSVTTGLLIIVVVGLCYVAFIKYGKGRGRRRMSQQNEWEIPVEDRGNPPDIV